MIAQHSSAALASRITNSDYPNEFLESKRAAQSRPFFFLGNISKNDPYLLPPLNAVAPLPPVDVCLHWPKAGSLQGIAFARAPKNYVQ
jgi:hypothetical protein